jgi:hypothetical protein
MRTVIVKVDRMAIGSTKWLGTIQKLQQKRYPVQKSFKNKADLNIVLSGAFENPCGFNGCFLTRTNGNQEVRDGMHFMVIL